MREDIEQLRRTINDFYRKEGGSKRDVLTVASEIKLAYLSTGSRSLDRALGGGLVRGRTVEFSGELSTLKTYFSLSAIANAQAIGMRTAFYDLEGSFESARAEQLGVNVDDLLLIDRNLRGDEGLDVVEQLLLEGNFLIVVDSIAALVPKAEAERRMGEETVARQAALMSKAMRKLTSANRDSILICINQLRESIGVMFGSPIKAPGGKALGFYATHRVRFTRIDTFKEERKRWRAGKQVNGKVEVAQLIQAKIEKSKIGQPFQEAVFRFDLERGLVDDAYELLNLGLELGLVHIEGQSYIWGEDGEVKARFAKGALKKITEEPEILAAMIDQRLADLREGTLVEEADEVSVDEDEGEGDDE
jgi:recombination protein RecA